MALLTSVAVTVCAMAYDNSKRRPNSQYAAAESAQKHRPAPSQGGICASFTTQVGVDRYCVSSVLKGDPVVNRFRYGPESLFDKAEHTAWVEGVDGQGIGEWVVVEFDQLRLVKGIDISNGYNKDRDIFQKNSRVKELTVEYSERGNKRNVILKDIGIAQPIPLPNDQPLKAYWVKFTIESVYPGTKFQDTAISELHIASEPVQP